MPGRRPCELRTAAGRAVPAVAHSRCCCRTRARALVGLSGVGARDRPVSEPVGLDADLVASRVRPGNGARLQARRAIGHVHRRVAERAVRLANLARRRRVAAPVGGSALCGLTARDAHAGSEAHVETAAPGGTLARALGRTHREERVQTIGEARTTAARCRARAGLPGRSGVSASSRRSCDASSRSSGASATERRAAASACDRDQRCTDEPNPHPPSRRQWRCHEDPRRNARFAGSDRFHAPKPRHARHGGRTGTYSYRSPSTGRILEARTAG